MELSLQVMRIGYITSKIIALYVATYTKTQNYWSQLMKTSHSIIIILLTIAGLSWLSYTIVDQQKQIEQLQEQLQYEQMKYKIIINDPLLRDAMESGG